MTHHLRHGAARRFERTHARLFTTAELAVSLTIFLVVSAYAFAQLVLFYKPKREAAPVEGEAGG